MDGADGGGVAWSGASDADHAARFLSPAAAAVMGPRCRIAAKKPSVPCRAGLVSRNSPSPGGGPDMPASAQASARGKRGEIGVAAEEGADLLLVLGGQQGTGSVDQAPAARTHQARGGVEDRRLLGQEFGEVLGPGAECARPGCAARCRCRCRARPPARGRRRRPGAWPSGRRARAGAARHCPPRRGAAGAPRPSSRGAETSQAVMRPRFPMAAASARVLPPAPAQ